MTWPIIDVLIAIPLLPALPMLITWWLPWERWVPWGKLPKAFLGPYLLYASFAAWYFALGWLPISVALIAGAGLSIMAIVGAIKKMSLPG